ncbi:MAG: hypothetical protein U1E76_20015 [Planctomycetota bacterium]
MKRDWQLRHTLAASMILPASLMFANPTHRPSPRPTLRHDPAAGRAHLTAGSVGSLLLGALAALLVARARQAESPERSP